MHMKPTKNFFLSLFFLITFVPVKSQQFKIVESELLEHGSGDLIYLPGKSGFLLLAENFIARYDSSLKKVYSNDLEPILPKKVVTRLFAIGGKYYVLSVNTRKAETTVVSEINPIDGTIVSGSTKELLPVPYEQETTLFQYSPDGRYAFVLIKRPGKKKDIPEYDGYLLDSTLQPVNFSVTFPNEKKETGLNSFLINNSGYVTVLYTCAEESKITPVSFHISIYNPKGVLRKNQQISFPEGRISNIKFLAQGDKLLYFANFFPPKMNVVTQLQCGSVQPSKEIITPPAAIAITDAGSEKQEDEYFMDGGFSIRDFFFTKDGSITLIFERSNIHYTRYSERTTIPFHQYGAIHILKLTADQALVWHKYLYKKQEQAEVQTYIGSRAVSDGNDGVHIFFHEKKINTNIAYDKEYKYGPQNLTAISKFWVTDLYVDKDGKMKKIFISSDEDKEVFFSPVSSINDKPNEVYGFAVKKRYNNKKDLFAIQVMTITY